MSARVTDDMVRDFLIWAKNYGEIASYQKIADSGRKWKIVLPEVVEASNFHNALSIINIVTPERLVPVEIVLTSREALVFGYGLAVAGARGSRAAFAKEHWNG